MVGLRTLPRGWQALPRLVREHTYTAVGSTNTQMVTICTNSPRYEYIGSWVMHALTPPIAGSSAGFRAKKLDASGFDDAWAFLSAHRLNTEHTPSRLLLPARFYAWRHLTQEAVQMKLTSGRVTVVLDGATSRTIALFVQFDNDFAGWPLKQRCRFHLGYFAPQLEAGTSDALACVLRAFGASQPSEDHESGEALTTILVAGPYDNTAPSSKGDVDPLVAKALLAAGFTRPRDTHLRVYKVPAP